MPRPTTLTPELAAAICEKLAEHGSLRRVCLEPDMPLERTVRRWYVENPEFASEYARAKEAGIEALVDETLDIGDEMPPTTAAGATDPGYVAWSKVRIETRRWLAERLMPKKYGVRSGVDVTNSDGSLTVDADARAKRLAALMAQAKARQEASQADVDLDDIV